MDVVVVVVRGVAVAADVVAALVLADDDTLSAPPLPHVPARACRTAGGICESSPRSRT